MVPAMASMAGRMMIVRVRMRRMILMVVLVLVTMTMLVIVTVAISSMISMVVRATTARRATTVIMRMSMVMPMRMRVMTSLRLERPALAESHDLHRQLRLCALALPRDVAHEREHALLPAPPRELQDLRVRSLRPDLHVQRNDRQRRAGGAAAAST